MQNKNHPCYQCPDRVLGCHSTCEKYEKAKSEDIALKRQIIKGRYENAIRERYGVAKCERLKKRK